MRSQFWNTITPVDGQTIPNGAEYRADETARWCDPDLELFPQYDQGDIALQWRVPVEACPMSIAVDAIASSAQFNHDKQQYDVWIVDGYTSGCTEQALKDAIASRLRELADKEFPE